MQPATSEAAAILARCRRGITERPSARKQASNRRNLDKARSALAARRAENKFTKPSL